MVFFDISLNKYYLPYIVLKIYNTISFYQYEKETGEDEMAKKRK